MATLDDLASRAASATGLHYGDIDVREQLRAWARRGIEELVERVDWPFQVASTEPLNSVPGVSTYTLGANLDRVLEVVRDNTGLPLAYTPRPWITSSGLDPAATGQPWGWYYSAIDASGNLQLVLYPQPTGAVDYTVRGAKRLQDLDGTDVLPVPKAFLTAAQTWIESEVAHDRNNQDAWRRKRSDFNLQVRQLRDHYERPRARRPALRYTDIPGASRAFPDLRVPETIPSS